MAKAPAKKPRKAAAKKPAKKATTKKRAAKTPAKKATTKPDTLASVNKFLKGLHKDKVLRHATAHPKKTATQVAKVFAKGNKEHKVAEKTVARWVQEHRRGEKNKAPAAPAAASA